MDGISLVTGKTGLKKFEQIPELLHRANPNYVPPFPGSVAKVFDPSAPYAQYCTFAPFVAYRGGRPVGRICAIDNRSHTEYYGDRTGFFGFFDCIDDESVAKELVAKAREWLKGRGMHSMRGPYNPTISDELGVLIEGFDSKPIVMMPYNPPYYDKLLHAAGLVKYRDLLAFYIRRDAQPPERMFKIAERVKKSTGLKMRLINLNDVENELKIIHDIYNRSLDRNSGFVPITMEDLRYAAKDLLAVADPELIYIAEKDGKAAGFSLALPDINEHMHRSRKLPRWMRPLGFLWNMKTKRPKNARLWALGVAPEYRGKGVGPMFYIEALLRGGNRYEGGELSWIEDNNEEIIKGITLMGGQCYKKYRLYEGPVVGNA